MSARFAAALAGAWLGLGSCAGAWGESGAELSAIVVTATRVPESSMGPMGERNLKTSSPPMRQAISRTDQKTPASRRHFLENASTFRPQKKIKPNQTELKKRGKHIQPQKRRTIWISKRSSHSPLFPQRRPAPDKTLSVTTLTQQVAQILKLAVSEALTRLVTEYACSSSLSLLGEADAAREWIDDGTRNRNSKCVTVAFFRRWLQREQGQDGPAPDGTVATRGRMACGHRYRRI